MWTLLLLTLVNIASGDPFLHRVKRVIGGERAEVAEWPWVVSLDGRIPQPPLWGIFPRTRKFTCGASVLNDRWLLTAAHCFEGRGSNPRYWRAILGTRKRRSSLVSWAMHVAGRLFNRDDWLRYRIRPDLVIRHPRYSETMNWLNDIALIRLEEEVPSGPQVARIRNVAIPQQGNTSFPEDGYVCHMVGWGCQRQGGGAVEIAHDVTLPKYPDVDCGAIYGVSTQTRFCAGRKRGNSGICSGDSGGPLTCYDGEKWVQVGIASFTSERRPGKFPGAFTRVAMFSDWINETIQNNQN